MTDTRKDGGPAMDDELLPGLPIVRQSHPYDDGYWLRFDGSPRSQCASDQGRQGWDDCNEDQEFETLQRTARDTGGQSDG